VCGQPTNDIAISINLPQLNCFSRHATKGLTCLHELDYLRLARHKLLQHAVNFQELCVLLMELLLHPRKLALIRVAVITVVAVVGIAVPFETIVARRAVTTGKTPNPSDIVFRTPILDT
jgi:hypothetical protein